MLPAIRGILPRTDGVFAKDSGDKDAVRLATKPSGKMPDAASKMLAVPETGRMRRFPLVQSTRLREICFA
jgi:hypothetical protein